MCVIFPLHLPFFLPLSPPFKRNNHAFCGKKIVANITQELECSRKEDASRFGKANVSARDGKLERPQAASQLWVVWLSPPPPVSVLKASL